VSRSLHIATLAALGLLLVIPSVAGAQRPVASAQISATLGTYRPADDTWTVVLDWQVDCVGGNRFAWTIYLREKPNGEYVTSTGLSPTGIDRRAVLVPARGRSYDVTPEITARCFAATGSASSEYVTAYGAALTIPPRRVDDTTLPSGCENAIAGTYKDNVLNGTRGRDTLLGYDGSDRLYGLGGADCLLGHRGADFLAGGRGNDALRGGVGRDTLRGNGGRNRLYGGEGNDRLDARNGRRDLVNCGAGRADVARVDAADRVRGCERRAP
jgi:RTX calcium-binding nonapeptide repeat (4 copies)